MYIHLGQVAEKVVRRNGHSISDLARLTNINRRTVYNWFNQQQLKPEIIHRIGCAINHDFSIELPQYFSPEDFNTGHRKHNFVHQVNKEKTSSDNAVNWQEKYIELLERYNALLLSTQLIDVSYKEISCSSTSSI